ncbi:MAG TPA: hypothetical protein VJS30_14400 [Paraburkholderia sp.]|nr:hypothetical protein [Paraburkholderia sp.]
MHITGEMLITVAVFGAGNFPFAVAGGGTAAALAGSNPLGLRRRRDGEIVRG